MSAQETHPDNERLVSMLQTLAHLSIRRVHWESLPTRQRLLVEFQTCDAYQAACDLLKVRNDGGRLLAAQRDAHRVFDASTRDGRTVIEHHCWPQMTCWNAVVRP